jgi:hypothetical protein
MHKEKAAVSCFMEEVRSIIKIPCKKEKPAKVVAKTDIQNDETEVNPEEEKSAAVPISVKAIKKKNPKTKRIAEIN